MTVVALLLTTALAQSWSPWPAPCGKIEPVPACVERLRGLLRDELAAKSLAVLDPVECRRLYEYDYRCESRLDACSPRAGAIAMGLTALGRAAAPAAPELWQLEARHAPRSAAIAFEALVAINDPRARDLA